MTDLALINPTVESLLANLDRGQQALLAATDDYERLEIRDFAQRAQVASAILNRQDIAVKWSILAADCERIIDKNKATLGETRGGDRRSENYQSNPGGTLISEEQPMSKKTESEIKKAHRDLSDDEYEAKKKEAINKNEVLTRQSLQAAVKDKQKAERESERQAKIVVMQEQARERDEFEIYHCSCAELVNHLPAESVDLICTDIPYERKAIDVCNELRNLAIHLLAPGGSLIVLTGQMYLPQYLQLLSSDARLQWHWLMAQILPGGGYQPRTRSVGNSHHKPLLWFTKGKDCDLWTVNDTVLCPPQERREDTYDEWGQHVSNFKSLFESLRLKNSQLPHLPVGLTVVDPFCGGGAIGLAALEQNLRYVGCDINEEDVKTTQGRLTAFLEERDAQQGAATAE